jgi:hypothetical protein
MKYSNKQSQVMDRLRAIGLISLFIFVSVNMPDVYMCYSESSVYATCKINL